MWLAMRFAPRTTFRLVGVPPSLVPSLAPEDRASLDECIEMLLPISKRRYGMINDARNQSGVEPLYPLTHLTVPTMLVSAEDDLYQTLRVARHAADIIPNARVVAVKTGGHLLLGRGDEVWPPVAAFLQPLPSTRAAGAAPARALAGTP
jgi:pimeloyl-ACP methyl ester carboxylesterase